LEPVTKPIENSPRRYRLSFEKHLEALRAVPEERYVTITLDVPSVVTSVSGICTKIARFRDEIVTHMPTFEIVLFDNLPTLAEALGHAQVNHKTASESPATLTEFGDAVTKTREVLAAEVTTLIARGLLKPEVLNVLKGATGYKNTAFDVLELANILRIHWDTVSSRTSLTLAELDEAEVQATQLAQRYGDREQALNLVAQTTKDRQAAYTLLMETYEEVRLAIRYLRRKEGDADSLVPSLYLGRSYGKKSDSESPASEPVTTTPVVTTPAVNAPTTTSSTASNTAKSHIETVGPFA
jgi:hypothetical protein